MDEIGKSYLKLALDLDRHFEGFVDAYFGPPELKEQSQANEPRPLKALADDARQIQAAIKDSSYDPQRKDFLTGQMRAMTTVIDNLRGEQFDFVTEVERYFDVIPEMVDEATFEAAHAEMDNLLPGSEPLAERLAAWKKQLELESSRILPVLELACQETRRRTIALFELPAGEEMSLQLVSNQPWSGYNWYLGNYRSRIDINTDLPIRADSVVPLMAHEAYAGHHTEHAIKEAVLYKDGERAEHAVQLLLAPECVLSEGIANSARKVIFDRADLAAFLHEELYALAGLPHVNVDQQIHLAEAARDLRGVDGNAALMLHRDGHAADEVQRYIERYSLRTPKEAAQTIKFIQNPLFRSYIFNYAIGETLLAPLVEGPEAVPNFRRLLREPLTPSQVRQWLAQKDTG
jgi:hypothetical protein